MDRACYAVHSQTTTLISVRCSQMTQNITRTSTEAFGQACSPVVHLPSFPGSPSPIRESINLLAKCVPSLGAETIVKLQFEEAAVSVSDQPHTWTRISSLGFCFDTV